MHLRLSHVASLLLASFLCGCSLDDRGTATYGSEPHAEGGAAGARNGEGGVGSAGKAGQGGHGGAAAASGSSGVAGKGGSTSFPCPPGRGDCDAIAANGCEVDLASDPDHCGSCDKACTVPPHSVATCNAGACSSRCASGFGDCDGDGANGCETDLATTPLHCGSCENACPSGANGSATCTAAACGVACNAGFGDCDGDPGNGCEANLASDPAHCGGCAVACPAGQNATPTCTGGTCQMVCAPPFADCDGDPTNGCEVDLTSDAAHCGACAMACPALPNEVVACVASACQATCEPGFVDCDGDIGDGCEANVASPSSCGGCGHVCGTAHATPSCAAGACSFQCAAGFAHCSNDDASGCETSVTSDVANCGGCGVVCSGVNASPACVAGVCNLTCALGFADCDGKPGCETSLTAASSCGSCGHVCGSANGTASCKSGGICAFTCNPGYAHCSVDDASGCETHIDSDVANCGGCGVVCGSTNATPSCIAGACSLACHPGFHHCTGTFANGCETATDTDPQNCGACGHVCGTANGTSTCVAAKCKFQCAAGHAHCSSDDATGCETLIAGGDVGNCGACGHVCGAAHATPSCVAGACQLKCDKGFAHCTSDDSTGCETDVTTPAACGTCGHVCGAANGTPSCVAGACSFACAPGYAHCGASDATGCETLIGGNDAKNCGSCGHDCGAGSACVSGVCQAVDVATGLASPTDVAVDATSVFWLDASDVRAAPKSGGAGVVLATAQNGPRYLALDPNFVYWTTSGAPPSFTDGTVSRAKKDGTDSPVPIDTSEPFPTGLATDGTRVFWARKNTGEIWTALVDGSSPAKLTTSDPSPGPLVLANDSLFWLSLGAPDDGGDSFSNGSLTTVKTDGTGKKTLATGIVEPSHLAVDDTYVYWTSRGTAPSFADGTVHRANLDGTQPTVLASMQGEPIGVVSDGKYVYWASFLDGTISKIARDGSGGVITVAASENGPWGVAFDATYVFFTDKTAGAVRRVVK